jgi:hypothetical protein
MELVMTKDEALKMAIEAIEYTNWSERTAKMETALKACKEALEQPAQEPVAIVESHYGFTDAIVTFLTENHEQLPIGTLLYAEKEKNHE